MDAGAFATLLSTQAETLEEMLQHVHKDVATDQLKDITAKHTKRLLTIVSNRETAEISSDDEPNRQKASDATSAILKTPTRTPTKRTVQESSSPPPAKHGASASKAGTPGRGSAKKSEVAYPGKGARTSNYYRMKPSGAATPFGVHGKLRSNEKKQPRVEIIGIPAGALNQNLMGEKRSDNFWIDIRL